jgi:hypothetical protein
MIVGLYMSKIEFDFYTKLKNDKKVRKPIPATISKSSIFQSLVSSKIIEPIKRGKGYIEVLKQESFDKFYANKFPNPHIDIKTEIDNQKKFRDTKATNIDKDRVIFIRGFRDIVVNNQTVDLREITQKYQLFSTVLRSMKVDKLCFVENLQPFLNAQELLGEEFVYIHFYGRFPKADILKTIECKEYLHFGDYDFVGLSEYLRASTIYPNSDIFIPDNFEYLFKTYSKQRKEKDTIYKNVETSTDKKVIRLKELLKSTGDYLEQQIVMDSL